VTSVFLRTKLKIFKDLKREESQTMADRNGSVKTFSQHSSGKYSDANHTGVNLNRIKIKFKQISKSANAEIHF
jgi:hypothetical protein